MGSGAVRWKRRVASAALALALGSVVGLTSGAKGADREAAQRVQIGGPFKLIDQHGAVRRDTDFKGQYMLVYFGYNWCPDICPSSLYNMTLALEKLGAAADRVQPIYITVDPERDTVEEMNVYADHFHPSLIALTGLQAQIAAVASAYGVRFNKAEEARGEDYFIDHTSFVYLMDPEGQFLRFFVHETTPDDMAAGIQKYF